MTDRIDEKSCVSESQRRPWQKWHNRDAKEGAASTTGVESLLGGVQDDDDSF